MKKQSSHILRHQEEVHSSEEKPKFTMRVVRSYISALARQVGEAVRIRRRGGEGRILNSKAEYSRCVIPRLVLDKIDEEELERMEREELEAKKEQLEVELSEWEDIRYYARENKLKEVRMKIKRIERKIEARKRDDPDFVVVEAKRKRRKLLHPVVDEGWGGDEVRMTTDRVELGVRGPPALAGGEILCGEDALIKVGCIDPEYVVQPSSMNTTTSQNNLVVGGEVGAAPCTDMEPKSRLVQPLITDMLAKQVHLQLTGYAEQGGTISGTHTPTFDDDMVCPGEEDTVETDSRQAEHLSPAPDNKGMTVDSNVDACNVKDIDSMTMPSSGEGDDCNFKRGICVKHGMKGEKFVEVSKAWRDRGGGRGYGYVTQRRVKFRCKVASGLLKSSSSSSPPSEVGGLETCGERQQ